MDAIDSDATTRRRVPVLPPYFKLTHWHFLKSSCRRANFELEVKPKLHTEPAKRSRDTPTQLEKLGDEVLGCLDIHFM